MAEKHGQGGRLSSHNEQTVVYRSHDMWHQKGGISSLVRVSTKLVPHARIVVLRPIWLASPVPQIEGCFHPGKREEEGAVGVVQEDYSCWLLAPCGRSPIHTTSKRGVCKHDHVNGL